MPLLCVCGETQDPLGDHALSCRKSGLYFRHNLIRDTLRELLESSGCKVSPGEPNIPGAPGDRLDLLVASSDQGRPLAMDTSVSHPLQPSFANAEVDPRRLLGKVATLKKMRYGAQCDASGWALSAIVALTTGQWSSSTSTLVSSMARRLSMSSGKDAGTCAELIWARLSIALMRGCSLQLRHCFPAPGGESPQRDGCERPLSVDADLLLTPL